ncbi:MAG TPA: response regulator [Bacteroidetes bacterium]|nr:response regulator [Bacteroidota bacterium]
MQETTAKTILVVEDEPDVLTYLVTFFKINGFNVLTATDGRKGFETAKNNHPDLISLDITMPEESGVRMYRNLHDDPSTRDIPVIIITGVSGEFKGFIESRKHINPPAGYFEKPIDREVVLARIKEILGM